MWQWHSVQKSVSDSAMLHNHSSLIAQEESIVVYYVRVGFQSLQEGKWWGIAYISQRKNGETGHNQEKRLKSLLLLCISVSASLEVTWRWCSVNYSMSYPFRAFNDTFYSDTRNYEILRRPFATSRSWRRLMLETLWDSYFWLNCLFLQSMKMFLSLIKEYEQYFFRMALQ